MAIETRYQMIDNYIYLYHTKTLIVVPAFVDGVTDSSSVSFSQSTPLSRTAPIYSYTNSGPRSLRVDFNLHRDMMYEINYGVSNVNPNAGDDYVDYLIKAVQAAALPTYEAASKMVNPPVVAVRLGNDIFIKGVVTGDVGVTYNFPIIGDNHYGSVRFGFNISEIDPYEAEEVMKIGSYRGVPLTLDRLVYTDIAYSLGGNSSMTNASGVSGLSSAANSGSGGGGGRRNAMTR